MTRVVTNEDIGKGLEISTPDVKLAVKAGRNVVVDAGGVHVDFPAPPTIPKAVSDIAISGTTVTKTFTDGTNDTEQLPAPTVDIKLAGLSFEGGKLKATLSDNSTVDTEFSSAFLIAAIEALPDADKAKVVTALLPQIRTALVGEEIKSFDGTRTLGNLIKPNQ